MWLHIHLCVLLLRYDVGVLFGTEIHQYWWENNAKFFAVNHHAGDHCRPFSIGRYRFPNHRLLVPMMWQYSSEPQYVPPTFSKKIDTFTL